MIKVFAIVDGVREFYTQASNNREYYKAVDEIEEMGVDWDIELI